MAGKKKTNKAKKAQNQAQTNDLANLALYQPASHQSAALTQAESVPDQNRPAVKKQPHVKKPISPRLGAQLDLPEGYKRPKKSSNRKRASQKTATLPDAESTSDRDRHSCQQTTHLNNMAKGNPLAGAADKVVLLPDSNEAFVTTETDCVG
jgi:hypothetical protein